MKTANHKNFDRQIFGSVQISSYCIRLNDDIPIEAVPSDGVSVMHVIHVESLAKYIPFDVRVKTSLSKATIAQANGSVAFIHVAGPPDTMWNASLQQVLPADKDVANVKCHQAAQGLHVEIESRPGDIEYKQANATRWTVSPGGLSIKIVVP